jgi:hypothetical protein
MSRLVTRTKEFDLCASMKGTTDEKRETPLSFIGLGQLKTPMQNEDEVTCEEYQGRIAPLGDTSNRGLPQGPP